MIGSLWNQKWFFYGIAVKKLLAPEFLRVYNKKEQLASYKYLINKNHLHLTKDFFNGMYTTQTGCCNAKTGTCW